MVGEVISDFLSRACHLWTPQCAVCASSRENLVNKKAAGMELGDLDSVQVLNRVFP